MNVNHICTRIFFQIFIITWNNFHTIKFNSEHDARYLYLFLTKVPQHK